MPTSSISKKRNKSLPKKIWRLFFLTIFAMLPLFSPSLSDAGVPLTVEVSGLKEELQTNALNFLTIEKNRKNKDLTARWIQQLHEQAPQEIREALYPFGYYHAKIQSKLIETDGKWTATYSVDAGEPTYITKYTIQWSGEGASLPKFQQSIRDLIANSDGQVIHAKYEAAKSNFLNLALSQGYPQAKITKSKILVDLDSHSAELILLMDTGPLYYFGDVNFKQDFLDPDLLQKYVTLQNGAPYSNEALIEFQQNLIASDYASEVTLNPLFSEAKDKLLPIEVLMKPILPHKLSFGLGYETDIGIRGSARWEDRLFNSHGHHSDLYFKLSQKEGKFQGQYFIPVHNAITDSWVSSAGMQYEETPDTKSKTVDLETAFVRRNLEDTRFYKAFLLASYDYFTIGDDPEVGSKLFSIGSTIRFSDIEDDIYPQFGYSFFADLRGASEALLSETTYSRLHMKGRYMFGLGENGRIDSHLEIGSTWVDDYSVYPASLRFFAGGDSSVRGYRYQSLGPEDKDGTIVGGKYVFTTSLEYDHRVADSWVLDVFTDAGNAYNDTMDDLYLGSGFGFRWLAPFGSLRVDLAWPVSENPDIGDVRLHLGFGATL